MARKNALSSLQVAMLRALRTKHPEPLSVFGFDTAPAFALSTARSLEKRGLAEVGSTDRRGTSLQGKEYLVSMTNAGSELALAGDDPMLTDAPEELAYR